MQEHIFKRLSLIYEDESQILKKYLNNPDEFVNNLKNAKYPLLAQEQLSGKYISLIPKDGTIKFANGYSIKGETISYVLINENGKSRLIFGENHSYLSLGKNVEYAGNIKFTGIGNISYLDNGSGHYMPDFSDLNGKNKVIKTLNETFNLNIDINKFQIYK